MESLHYILLACLSTLTSVFSVFLTQVMGISEAMVHLMGSGCVWWQVGGTFLFLFGPIAFVIFSAWSIFHHRSCENIEYEKSEWPKFSSCREEIRCYGKPLALYDYYADLKVRGEWSSATVQGRHWVWVFFVSFLMRFCS